MISLNGSEGASRASIASLRDGNHGDGESRRSSVHPEEMNQRSRSDRPSNEIKPVYIDEISSSVDENAGREDGLLDCGVIPSNCLPCLAATVPTVEKRSSLSYSPPSARKKAAHKLSFKWRDGHPNANICEYFLLLSTHLGFFVIWLC